MFYKIGVVNPRHLEFNFSDNLHCRENAEAWIYLLSKKNVNPNFHHQYVIGCRTVAFEEEWEE